MRCESGVEISHNEVYTVTMITLTAFPEIDDIAIAEVQLENFEIASVPSFIKKLIDKLNNTEDIKLRITKLSLALARIEKMIDSDTARRRQIRSIFSSSFETLLRFSITAKQLLQAELDELTLEASKSVKTPSKETRINLEDAYDLMTLENLAAVLGKSYSWLSREYQTLGIPYRLVGSSPRFLKARVKEWLDQNEEASIRETTAIHITKKK